MLSEWLANVFLHLLEFCAPEFRESICTFPKSISELGCSKLPLRPLFGYWRRGLKREGGNSFLDSTLAHVHAGHELGYRKPVDRLI